MFAINKNTFYGRVYHTGPVTYYIMYTNCKTPLLLLIKLTLEKILVTLEELTCIYKRLSAETFKQILMR